MISDSARDYSNEELVKGLEIQDSQVIQYLYEKVGPMVYKLIIDSGGKLVDAKDIFQEGILAAFLNIRSGKYQPSSNAKFSTYLIQICKFKWYDLNKSSYMKKKSDEEMKDISDESEWNGESEVEERIRHLYQLLGHLGERCKKILHFFYWEKMSIEEIGLAMGLEANSAKNQKYRCMQKLKDLATHKK